MEALKKRILQDYVTPGHPIAYAGQDKVANYYNISKSTVANILKENFSYTIHKEYKKPKFYNPFFTKRRRHTAQVSCQFNI